MKLAVFTNQFPGPVSTFFARDMRGLLDAGIEIEIFAIYPLNAALWRYVPDVLNDKVLPRHKVHHLTIREYLGFMISMRNRKPMGRFLVDALCVGASAARHGLVSVAKTSYVLPKAWSWAAEYGNKCDHVLAYWGNYTATCAYLFHRIVARPIPFSLFLHAGPDLYRANVYMREKLLHADNILTCSSFNRKFLKMRFPDVADRISNKVYVHRHGLDLAEFSFDPQRRSQSTVIAAGRLEKEKGFDYLIKAVHRLAQKHTRLRTEIVGDGSQIVNLKSLATKLKIADRVTFRGWLTPEETKAAIRQATMLVHPASGLGDGVPNVIKESMALGTPVIASEIAGIPELLESGKHGILVPARDINALATAIEALLQNETLRHNYAKSARRYVESALDLYRNGRQLRTILEPGRRNNRAVSVS